MRIRRIKNNGKPSAIESICTRRRLEAVAVRDGSWQIRRGAKSSCFYCAQRKGSRRVCLIDPVVSRDMDAITPAFGPLCGRHTDDLYAELFEKRFNKE